MDVYFEPNNTKFLSSRQPDIDTQSDVIEYLKAEYHEMILYVSYTSVVYTFHYPQRIRINCKQYEYSQKNQVNADTARSTIKRLLA